MPDVLLHAIVSRPELVDYAPKLRLVKAQMEHARGAAQAQQASGSEKELYEVDASQSSPLVWHFQAATQWAGLAALQQLYAVTSGKGKGGKGGKTVARAQPSPASATTAARRATAKRSAQSSTRS